MSILSNASERFYRKAKPLLTPNLRHSQYEYRHLLELYITPSSRWLDAGCGSGVFPGFVKDRGTALAQRSAFAVGMDCFCPNLWENRVLPNLVAGDMGDFPFRDGAFNVVTANMVVEHISDPDAIGRSVNRILAPGGVFIFHTPNLLNYGTIFSALIPQALKNRLIRFLENRDEKDVFPTRYRLNTNRAIRKMACRNGFSVEEISLVNSTPETFALGPVALAIEMLLIRLSQTRLLGSWRSNLIVVLKKTAVHDSASALSSQGDADRPWRSS
jgi:SAM-dependent methyltransferase